MKRHLSLLITALAVLAIGAVHAGHDHDGPPKHKKHHHAPGEMPLLPPRLEKNLELTTDQQAKVGQLAAQFDKERDEWWAAHKPARNYREEMRAAHEAGDEQKVKALQTEMRQHGKPLMELRKSYMDQVRALLTPEQVATLDEARERFKEKHGKWAHHKARKHHPGEE